MDPLGLVRGVRWRCFGRGLGAPWCWEDFFAIWFFRIFGRNGWKSIDFCVQVCFDIFRWADLPERDPAPAGFDTPKTAWQQWRLLPCNRRFWGINGGLIDVLGECSWQVTPQKCLTRRVLSRCSITFEQNRSKKHEQFSTALTAVFDRFWPKILKNQIAKKSSRHHGALKPLPKHLQCTPLTKPSTTNQV